jgi:uncharacterized membrane protein YfcA
MSFTTDPLLVYSVLLPVVAIGGILRGAMGFGGPLFMMPFLNVFFAPAITIAVTMWIDLFSNLRLIPDAYRDSSRAVVLPLSLGTLLAMPAGAALLMSIDPLMMKRVISGAILATAVLLLAGWRYRRDVSAGAYVAVGVVSGFIMGTTAIAVVTSLFLNSGTRPAAQNRANFIVWVFGATLLLIAILAMRGVLVLGDVTTIAILAPVYVGGTILGTYWQRRASDQTMRQAALGLIMVIALSGLLL